MTRAIWRRTVLTALAALAAALTMIPIFWMVIVSLKTQRDALTIPPSFLFVPTFDAYLAVWSKAGMIRGLINSVLVSGLTGLM